MADNRPFCVLCVEEKVEKPWLGIIATRFPDGVRKGICYKHYQKAAMAKKDREDKLLEVHKLFFEGKLNPNI